MALFIAANFGVVGGQPGAKDLNDAFGSGINEFSYTTEDTLAEVKTAGYFNELRDQVTINDLIHVVSNSADEDPTAREFSIIQFEDVFRSPDPSDLTMLDKDIQAS